MGKKIKADLRITMADLKEWFGEEMPLSVFNFMFFDAPKDMTVAEMRKEVHALGVQFRQPPSLARQAHTLFDMVKKNGNMPAHLVAQINAWEARFLRFLREEEAEAERAREVGNVAPVASPVEPSEEEGTNLQPELPAPEEEPQREFPQETI